MATLVGTLAAAAALSVVKIVWKIKSFFDFEELLSCDCLSRAAPYWWGCLWPSALSPKGVVL